MQPKAELRDYLAVERTLLAWIRTGLALMGFGFVVARFGLFLQQVQILEHGPTTQRYGVSLWFGTALIASGVVVNVLAASNHLRVVGQLNKAGPLPPRSSSLSALLALFLAVVGLGMAIYQV